MRMRVVKLMLVVLLACCGSGIHFQTVELREGWKMVVTSCGNQPSSLIGKEFEVSVPSTLHLNLQKYNQIPNPYFG